jgi:hypothetical protein
MKELNCSRADEADLVALYLAGKLPDDEAEAFEAHYLGCERCGAALREAGEIRAALGKPVLVPAAAHPGRSSSTHDVWTMLAAAAAVAAFFFGLGHLAQRQDVVTDAGVLRSGSTASLPLTITAGADGQVVLEWPAHADAQSYRIEVTRSDGLPVLESETTDHRVALAVSDLPPRPAGVHLVATIEALDGVRQVVAKSERQALPLSTSAD